MRLERAWCVVGGVALFWCANRGGDAGFRSVSAARPTTPVRIERSRDAHLAKCYVDGCLDFARHERNVGCPLPTDCRRKLSGACCLLSDARGAPIERFN